MVGEKKVSVAKEIGGMPMHPLTSHEESNHLSEQPLLMADQLLKTDFKKEWSPNKYDRLKGSISRSRFHEALKILIKRE